jgi:hypothetical protein
VRRRDLEIERARVLGVGLAVDEADDDVRDRVTGEDAALGSAADAALE